jgi:uncharacterized spore protein YtfJ
MALDRLFDTVEAGRGMANWRAAFGEPQVVGDRTLIPVAKVGYGFGLGFGRGISPETDEDEAASPAEGEGGGTGGFASARPLGTLVVTPEEVYFEQTLDEGRINLLRFGVIALLIIQVAATLRAIFNRL